MSEAQENPVYPFEDLDLTAEEITKIHKGLMNGASIGDVLNMPPAAVEGLYTLAYNHYMSGNFSDAEPLFKLLCLYKHNEVRFWTGLAGCRQALDNLPGAIDAYSMAGVVESLENPQHFLLAGMCYIKMGEREKAIDVLDGAQALGDMQNPEHAACHEKITHVLHMLRQQA